MTVQIKVKDLVVLVMLVVKINLTIFLLPLFD